MHYGKGRAVNRDRKKALRYYENGAHSQSEVGLSLVKMDKRKEINMQNGIRRRRWDISKTGRIMETLIAIQKLDYPWSQERQDKRV